jgi:hypothetical protein
MAATAEDLARLLVSIEFTQKQSEKQLAAIAKAAGQTSKGIEDKFKGANDNVGKSFETAGRRADVSMRQSTAAVSNLSFQLNDIAMQLASGTSPFTVMVQQGSQVAQVFQGTGGGLAGAVKTLGGAFAQMVNPISLASFAIIGLGGALVQYVMSGKGDIKSLDDGLKEHAEFISRVKEAYGDAAVGLQNYARESSAVFQVVAQGRIAQDLGTLRREADKLKTAITDSVDVDAFGGARAFRSSSVFKTLQAEIAALRKSIADGEPDIRGFRDRIADLAKADPTNKALQELSQKLLGASEDGLKAETALKQTKAVINGLGDIARGQSSGIDQLTKSIRELSEIAVPALTEMEKATLAYQSAIANATNREERDDAYKAFQAAQERIRNQNPEVTNSDGRTTGVPVPSSRPLVEFEELSKSTKKVKDTFDGLDGTVDRYVDQIVKAESGGKANAKNPNSSATGLGQFIESTWLSLFKEHFPDRAKNMSDATILALRTDADISRELIKEYAKQNAEILRAAGVSVNEAALHLAHFLGPQGAVAVLQAKAGTLASDVLSSGAVAANPTILGGGKTVDDVISYAEGRAGAYDKMRESAKALKVEQRELNKATDEFGQFSADIVTGFIGDLRRGASAADALQNALNKVLDKVIEIGIQSLFSGGGGLFGGAGAGGLLGGMIIPGILHSGGVAGKDGYGHGRSVSPSTFAGAKRYHTGGVAGLQPGEVPAILQRGEVVLPRGAKMGGQQNVHVTVGVSTDGNGNIMPFVETVSQAQVQKAAPKIVQAANSQVVPTMSRHQSQKAGAEWRM